MNARNAFARTETPEQFRRFNMGFRGPIVGGQDLAALQRRRQPLLRHAAPSSRSTRTAASTGDQVRRPFESTNVTAGIEHALTNNQTLRLGIPARSKTNAENQGVGGSTCPSAPPSASSSDNQLRASSRASSARRMLHEVRLQFNRQANEASSLTERPVDHRARRLQQGRRGREQPRLVARRSSWPTTSTSTSAASTRCASACCSRAAATRTSTPATPPAPSPSATSTPIRPAGRCSSRSASAQVDTSFSQYQLGLYWQDDIRVNNNFSFSVGVRNEMQSLIDDKSEPDAARRASRGRARRSRACSAAATALSTTGTSRTSTTRRCA